MSYFSHLKSMLLSWPSGLIYRLYYKQNMKDFVRLLENCDDCKGMILHCPSLIYSWHLINKKTFATSLKKKDSRP